MSDDDDDIGALVGGTIITVAAGFILYRVGKSIFRYMKDSGNTEVVKYVPDKPKPSKVEPTPRQIDYLSDYDYES